MSEESYRRGPKPEADQSADVSGFSISNNFNAGGSYVDGNAGPNPNNYDRASSNPGRIIPNMPPTN